MSRWFDGLCRRVQQLLADADDEPDALEPEPLPPGVEWARAHAPADDTPGFRLFAAQGLRLPRPTARHALN